MGVIFDLDQTIIDSSIAYEYRKNRNWTKVYTLIPKMKPYEKVVELIKILISQGTEVAVVTSSPRTYCEKILAHLGIFDVITVCYHDTDRHKPNPDPYLLAISKMKNQKGKCISVVGDEEADIIAAKAVKGANIISILAYWNNCMEYYNSKVQPDILCRDEMCLMKLFCTLGLETEESGLRRRAFHVYQLFDYYPISRTHDLLSRKVFEEVKEKNNSISICRRFCHEFKKFKKKIAPNTYGIFIVPSSTAGVWNRKLTNYVVPRLVESMKLIDCSKYILRHTTHEKQAFGGNRSVESNLLTMKLQYKLPSQMVGAFIIDDITTSGNVFESCRQILINEGIDSRKIYCVAIGGTVSNI